MQLNESQEHYCRQVMERVDTDRRARAEDLLRRPHVIELKPSPQNAVIAVFTYEAAFSLATYQIEEVEHHCVIAEDYAVCDCPDAQVRRTTCKHVTSIAMELLRGGSNGIEDAR